jgi:hypothetical protein
MGKSGIINFTTVLAGRASGFFQMIFYIQPGTPFVNFRNFFPQWPMKEDYAGYEFDLYRQAIL